MIGTWKRKIKNLNRKIVHLEGDKTNLAQQFEHLKNEITEGNKQIENKIYQFFSKKLEDDRIDTENMIQKIFPPNASKWEDSVWRKWSPNGVFLPSDLYAGRFVEQNGGKNFPYEIPAYLPFIGQKQTIILQSSESSSSKVYAMMHGLALRIALMIPHQSFFTFLDPSGFGKAFPYANQLETRENLGDSYKVLEDVMNDMRRIISTYGLADHKPFDSIADNIMINERLEFIFAANFPKNYERRTIERLYNIGLNGPIAGKYLFLHYNQDKELPRDFGIGNFENARIVKIEHNDFSLGNTQYTFFPDVSIPDALQTELVQKLKDSKPPERKISFDNEINLPPDQWWKKSSEEYIETSVGRSGSSDSLNIWFGAKKSEGYRPCAHGMLAAMTGAGKSNLYHVFIMGLALRYSPKELAFYLIDGKDGVEFQPYKYLPHGEFVSLKSQPQLSRSILAELILEKERRNELFSSLEVTDYTGYRRVAGNDTYLPRIVLVVDEYQELFVDDRDGLASSQLQSLAEQGRSVGIHMFLGSQRFGVTGMLHQSAVFGNIHLRIAMKMALADRNALTEFGKEGKQLISTCNLPGKLVLNDHSGDDGGNKLGKVALLEPSLRNQLVEKLTILTNDSDSLKKYRTINIFNGNSQPELLDNPQIDLLLQNDTWKSPQEMEEWVRKPIYQEGLGATSWFSGEGPLVGWVGQEYNVRGYAHLILRRRQRDNIMIIGDRNDARYGMISTLLISLVLNAPSSKIEFTIIDKSIPNTPWSKEMNSVNNNFLFPLGYKVTTVSSNSQIGPTVDHLRNLLDERYELDEVSKINLPSIILVLTESERIDELLPVPGKYGSNNDSELGIKLNEIIVRGPALGIYVLLSFESVMAMSSVIGRKGMEYFRHRIALQMSEDDAFTYVRNRKASRLQLNGPKPINALYVDLGNNRNTMFKPYKTGDELTESIHTVKATLLKRS